MEKRPTSPLYARFLCAFILCPFLTNAAIIYVNPGAVGANNGTSWANAFTSLSSALLAATSADEVWVTQGVYKPVTQIDFNSSGGLDAREATFQIPDGVAVYGGFSGTEVARDERNWETNLTVLSGDLDNNDINADGNLIAETVTHAVGSNAYHVVYTSNVSASTLVDGFIITAGRAEFAGVITDPNQDGGGWYNRLSGVINASSPTIRNTIFQGNYSASEGGAMYNTNGAAGGVVLSIIENCKFTSNKSNIAGGAINLGSFSAGSYQLHIISSEFTSNEAYRRGGALYLLGDHATIDSTRFSNNTVTALSPDASTLPGSGGGVSMVGSNAIFNNCIFEGNSSTGNPTGAFEGGGGGAVYMSTNEPQTTTLGISEPKFITCGFYNNVASGNTAAWGGAAVHLNDGGRLRPKYVNCVFSGNQAQNDGGAVASFTRVLGADGFVPELTPNFTNCTFSGNQAGARGGAIFNDGYLFMGSEVLNSRIENSILWNNTSTIESPEVHNTGNNLVAYSLIEGSGGSGGGWNSDIGTDGGNNTDANPGFINEGDPLGADNLPATDDDGLRLISTSPAVDEGNNAAVALAGITTDYILSPRVQGNVVDMGAYERAGLVIPELDIYWLDNWHVFKPVCLSCPWAFLLLDKTLQYYIWDGPAQLVDKGESAFIKGHIINPKNKNMGFDVYLKLINKHDWKSWNAKGRTYTAFTFEALLVAKKTHIKWVFWELSSESYLKGTGEVSGELKLTHLPSNHKVGFQLGLGANGWDKDPGMSGSFSYKGKILHRGKKVVLTGAGSMNVDAIPCSKGCTPFEEPNRIVRNASEITEEDFNTNQISVYPIPARKQLTILSEPLAAGRYTVKIYNNHGTLKKQEIMDTDNGNLVLPVDDLESGIYVLKLISSSGETLIKKLIVE